MRLNRGIAASTRYIHANERGDHGHSFGRSRTTGTANVVPPMYRTASVVLAVSEIEFILGMDYTNLSNTLAE